ncbi:MAG TPA: hypothetical protein VK821_14130 [Dehalococcoidia bacterium]|nr:hypothetical protein [Dehalococcoidia bacterium]
MPFILQAFPNKDGLQGLVVADVLHCGVCRPRPDPVRLDFLES